LEKVDFDILTIEEGSDLIGSKGILTFEEGSGLTGSKKTIPAVGDPG